MPMREDRCPHTKSGACYAAETYDAQMRRTHSYVSMPKCWTDCLDRQWEEHCNAHRARVYRACDKDRQMNRQTMIHLQLEHDKEIARALRLLAIEFGTEGNHDGPIILDRKQIGLVKTLYIGSSKE